MYLTEFARNVFVCNDLPEDGHVKAETCALQYDK